MDYFHTHILLRFLEDDFKTYKKAVMHFYGINLSAGDIISTRGVKEKSIIENSTTDAEEKQLLWAILADQHELCHYFQFMCTSFGIGYWVLSAIFMDYLRELASKTYLALKQTSQTPTLPLSDFIEGYTIFKVNSEVWGLNNIIKWMQFQLTVFDDKEINIKNAVEKWNTISDFLERMIIHDEDNIVHVRFNSPVNDTELANPAGITLRSLLECSARCNDYINLQGLKVSPSVRDKILFDLSQGEDYNYIFQITDNIIAPEFRFLAIIRMVGIALQSPISSYHHNLSERNIFDWKDFAPTWRFYRILKLIENKQLNPEEIISNPNYPDKICDIFGWVKISDQRKYFTENHQYKGRDALVKFVINHHHNFCKFTLKDTNKPSWMLDLLVFRTQNSQAYAQMFFPPFHFAGGEVITHPTCTDFNEMLDIYLIFLTCSVAKEMLYDHNVDETKRLLKAYVHWAKKYHKDFADTFEEDIWPNVFRSVFGFDFNVLN